MKREIVVVKNPIPKMGDIFFFERGDYRDPDPYIITKVWNPVLPFEAEGQTVYPFAQIDQEYSIPLESPWGRIQEVGNSGILRRRAYRLPVSVKPQECWIYDAKKKIVTPTVREFPDIEELHEKQNWLEKARWEAVKKAAENRLAVLFKGDKDVVEVRCFNDTPMAKYLPEDYIILHEYITTRGNKTVTLGKKKPVLRVPDELKGLVIGRHGQNIKAVCQKYGIRIKII